MLQSLLTELVEELNRAQAKFPAYNSGHEGLAIIWEEFVELQHEVFKGGTEPKDIAQMQREALQVAVTAIRFMLDVTSPELSTPPLTTNRFGQALALWRERQGLS